MCKQRLTNGDKLGSTPNETVLLNGTDLLLELGHVGLVIPRLDGEGDNGLGYGQSLTGSDLVGGLLGLGGLVGGDTLLLELLSGLVLLLVIGTEEVNLVVILLSGGGGSRRRRGAEGRGA
jgi:hypothetical protein